jgi:hypothetical protein
MNLKPGYVTHGEDPKRVRAAIVAAQIAAGESLAVCRCWPPQAREPSRDGSHLRVVSDETVVAIGTGYKLLKTMPRFGLIMRLNRRFGE